MNITIALSKELVEWLDKVADKEERSRSQVVRMILKQAKGKQ